jgi:hypothetical protein
MILASHPSRERVVRLTAGYGAVACALPYLGLKIVWLAGGTLGVAEQSLMRDGSMWALNAITAGMDLVGIGLALAFTHRWGLRVPAWLLLPPIWVATGLLARFVVWVPISAIITAMRPVTSPRIVGGPVQPWVYVIVYVEFVGLGIGLVLAFLMYAWRRWADAFWSTTDALPTGKTHDVQVPVATATALLAISVGVLHLAWAFGATVGLGEAVAARRTLLGSLVNATDAGMMVVAATGVSMMVHRLGRKTPFWLPLAMTWLGAGYLFGWGLWPLMNVLAETALLRGRDGMALVNLIHLLSMIVGLTMGLLMLFVLAERRGKSC